MSTPTPTPIRLITFNIRYAATRLAPFEHPWPLRLPHIAAHLRQITTPHTLLLLQEATHPQLLDILHALNDNPPTPTLTWSFIGHGRDGGPHGEHCPILYPTSTFHPEQDATLWLSPTPSRKSKGWDAALHRIVTVGRFRPLSAVGGSASVVVLNTHLDHAGRQAREESAGMLGRLAREWSAGTGVGAVFLGGDFNSTPGSEVIRRVEGEGWREVVDLVVGGEGDKGKGEITYTTFGEAEERRKKIDYLFVWEPKGVEVLGFEVLGNEAGGMLFSDHKAVVADVRVSE